MHLDPFMQHLGFEGGVTAPGEARLSARLGREHLNSWGSAHGGFLFALADSAFALAANSRGALAVSLAAHIEHLAPCAAGDTLEAVAREVSLTRKTGVYRVDVRAGDKPVALFTGTVYRKP